MKQIIACLALCVAPVFAAEIGQLNDSERAYLIEQLEQTKKEMLASIKGVSAEQWRYKPTPTTWSVAECAEHIILSEEFLGNFALQILKSPAVERPANSNSQVDHAIVARVADRSHKGTAPEPITPSGKFETPESAAREFALRRDKTIAYVKSNHDDLRTHMTKGTQLGEMDAYQILLVLASHSGRHTAQLREVQSNAGYPKSTAGN